METAAPYGYVFDNSSDLVNPGQVLLSVFVAHRNEIALTGRRADIEKGEALCEELFFSCHDERDDAETQRHMRLLSEQSSDFGSPEWEAALDVVSAWLTTLCVVHLTLGDGTHVAHG